MFAVPVGLLAGCGGSSGHTDDDPAGGSSGSPLADTYNATVRLAGDSEPRLVGPVTVDESGQLSGELILASPQIPFDVSGTISADGTLDCTIIVSPENQSYYYSNYRYSGRLTESGGTLSGTVTATSVPSSGGSTTATFTIVRQTEE